MKKEQQQCHYTGIEKKMFTIPEIGDSLSEHKQTDFFLPFYRLKWH
jgi:hypothetical protein